ncbi:amidohydrolase family protein [Lutimonas vermicola]|uniref:Amidohydrolase family protein n=1 Tax=Lutimonas vermicola TaxID=414288 RepID=A0ABU9L276_9FLAO
MRYFCVVFFVVFLISGHAQEMLMADIIIKNVNIVDVELGGVIPNKYLAIEEGKIKLIYDHDLPTSDSVFVIDGSGKYLIPGLWDMHAHYHSNYKYTTNLLIANGIMGLREMWGKMDTINYIREQSKLGHILAPDIYSSGNIINGERGWMKFKVVNNEEEAVNEIRRQANEGVDFIKIYNRFTKDKYIAISDICAELNIPFAGHMPNTINYWEAIEANQQSIEHQMRFLVSCSSNPDEYEKIIKEGDREAEALNFLVEHFDRKLFDSLAISLAKSNTWLCPTNIYWKNFYNRDNPEFINNLRLEYMPKNIQLFWGTPKETLEAKKEEFEAGRNNIEFNISLMKDLADAGVKIIAGTDYPNPYCYPGFSLHDELQLMVEGGMTSAQAIKTATYNPAVFMGKKSELGKVDEGYLASLVLLDENPLDDIRNTTKIRAVFIRGIYLDRSQLDEMLLYSKLFAQNSFKNKN